MEISKQDPSLELYPEETSKLITKTPDELLDYVKKYHEQYLFHVKKGFQYGVTIGFILSRMKDQLPMREYAKFRNSTKIPRRTAYNYIFMYTHREEVVRLLDLNYSLKDILKLINNNGKLPEPKHTIQHEAKQPRLIPLTPEQEKSRKESKAFFGRLARARKTKAISKADKDKAIDIQKDKIKKAENEIQAIEGYRVKD
jgi:hypothetical protein